MISHCPTDQELAVALHVPEEPLRCVLDEVAADLLVWSEGESWQQPSDVVMTCTVLPTGLRSMVLAFADPADLQSYLPEALLLSLDIATLTLRDLLSMLLSEAELDLVILKPQEAGAEGEPALYVGIQIERARLLAAVIQRSLMSEGGLGILLASFLKWMNEQHPDANRLLVSATMARAVLDQKLLSLQDLINLCGLDFDTVRVTNLEASQLFASWWSGQGGME